MSDTDSFIDEVTDEVRRDRLFALFRRYSWIGVVAIVLIVGGAAWNEWRKASARAEAEALGDAMIAAAESEDAAARAAALDGVAVPSDGAGALVAMARAGAQVEAGDVDAAVGTLNDVAENGAVPEVYREIAAFRALTLQAGTKSDDELRIEFDALSQPGKPLRLLAEEQLAILDIGSGDTDAAVERLRGILQDAETGPDLKQRATQAIVALGATPEAGSDTDG